MAANSETASAQQLSALTPKTQALVEQPCHRLPIQRYAKRARGISQILQLETLTLQDLRIKGATSRNSGQPQTPHYNPEENGKKS